MFKHTRANRPLPVELFRTRAERLNLLSGFAVAIVTSAVIACLMGCSSPGALRRATIEAERFVVLGADGKARARLGVNAEGEPSLELLSDAGSPDIAIRLASDGSREFLLQAANDQAFGLFSVDANGACSIFMKSGEAYLDMSCDKWDGPVVTLHSESGAIEMRLKESVHADLPPSRMIMGNPGPALVLLDSDYTQRAALALRRDGTVTLALFDNDLRRRVVAAITGDGHPTLTILDEHGQEVFRRP